MNINQTSHNFLHTFCVRPAFRFQSQGDNEEVLLVVRAHLFTQIWWIINSIILLFGLLLASYFFSMFLSPIQVTFSVVFDIVIVLAYIWLNILTWFFNIGIVTNERVIDIDFQGVIYKEITEARIDRIQDITEKAGGFSESFFDFGNLFIQTAGTEQNIEYDHIPHPTIVAKVIHQLTEDRNKK